MSAPPDDALTGMLADTWWFALTRRLPDEAFQALAERRVKQGFTAVQLVVGIPPEVGPEHDSASSPVGPAWTLTGTFNDQYLAFARQRIQYLNQQGLHVIVYGAWGHQIEWLGLDGMLSWWHRIIATLDDLDVSYCLTGESNLWFSGESAHLLPNKTTADFPVNHLREWVSKLPYRLQDYLIRGRQRVKRPFAEQKQSQRRQLWSQVLAEVRQLTERPFIIHTLPQETSELVVDNPQLLAAITTQTGHSETMRAQLWQRPLAAAGKPFINLEPWYEGILGGFGPADQLYAYWVSMLAGSQSYCYGAHGIWNVGDGHFLAQWGGQTFFEAIALDTPRLLALSHQHYLASGCQSGQTFYETSENQLLTIGRRSAERLVQFFPDVGRVTAVPDGQIWLPLQGCWTDSLPAKGPVVFFGRR